MQPFSHKRTNTASMCILLHLMTQQSGVTFIKWTLPLSNIERVNPSILMIQNFSVKYFITCIKIRFMWAIYANREVYQNALFTQS